MKHIHIIYTLIFSILFSQEFNPGPYGAMPFDTAGPFTVMDLNRPTLGDPNFDEEININDVIILVHYILETGEDLSFEEQQIGDLNSDGGINILDISLLIQEILYPGSIDLTNSWNFEEEWNGNESYV